MHVLPVMGKSKSRFNLNHDVMWTLPAIWVLRIWLETMWFALWLIQCIC